MKEIKDGGNSNGKVMEKLLIFDSAEEVRFGRVLKFIIPTYLTSLFNTVYTIVDGIFVSSCVGTNALAAINIVYPIVNVLTGIALAFATGGSSVAALQIGGKRKEEANKTFSVCAAGAISFGCIMSAVVWVKLYDILGMLGATPLTMEECKVYAFWWLVGTPVVVGKELFTYFIRVDGSPGYSFLTALSGGILNIILDYIFVGRLEMGILGAALATVLGLLCSFLMGIYYFIKLNHTLCIAVQGLSIKNGFRCAVNGMSEFINQLAIAITTIFFNRIAMDFAGEDGIAAVSIIMYLQFLFIGVYFGYSMGIASPLGYAYGDGKADVCTVIERYGRRFFSIAPFVIYGLTFFLAPFGVSFFAEKGTNVYILAVTGMRLYGVGFLFSGINIFSAIRMMTYGKGYFSGIITFLRSFALLLLFLVLLPEFIGMDGVWLAVPAAECLTFIVSVISLKTEFVPCRRRF